MNIQVTEDPIVYFNKQFTPLSQARVNVLTHALNYGTAVFEGIRGYWNAERQELFLLRPVEHYDRWKGNCGILRINPGLASAKLADITAELIRRNHFTTDVYVRPLAYKSAERIGIAPDDQDAFTIVVIPFGTYLDSSRGLQAGVSSWRRIQDNAIPARGKISGAYVNSVLASDEARQSGYDEAIFLNESGRVSEGASCNLFMVRKGKLITPSVTENVLEGVTRSAVMELARREMKLEVIERPIDRSELYIADEVFFTGTAVEVAPIIGVDRRPVGSGQPGPMTTELRRLYQEATRGRIPAYTNWLTPVYHPAALDRVA